MARTDDYFTRISKRGDETGGNGGLLDLLAWCGKSGLREVTVEEAKRFFEDPTSRYEENSDNATKDR